MTAEREWRCVIEKGTIVNVRDANDGLVAHVGGDDVEQREKRARLLAAAPAMWALIGERYAALLEDFTSRSERLAAAFQRETGMMAPGKDAPPAMNDHTDDERRDAWDAWCTELRRKEIDAHRNVIALVTEAT